MIKNNYKHIIRVAIGLILFLLLISLTITLNKSGNMSSDADDILLEELTTEESTTIVTTVTTIITTSSMTTTTTNTTMTSMITEETTTVEIIEDGQTEETEEAEMNNNNLGESLTYYGWYTATWYDNAGLGYSEGSSLYGSSGRTLISGYSVASNYFASGTILYISGGSHNGYYRVDDTGGMTNNVVDFYYSYRSSIPSQFIYDGIQSIEVWVVN